MFHFLYLRDKMEKWKLIVLAGIVFLFENECSAQQQWTLIEDKEEVRLYEWSNPGDSIRTFRAEFNIPAPISSCVKILYHAEFHTAFMDGIKSSELIKSPDEKSRIFYQIIDLPWPIPNRDIVTHALFDHSASFDIMKVTLKSIPGEKELTYMTRVDVPERSWIFTRTDFNSTTATYLYQSNPASIPALLEDLLTISGPMGMMARFRDVAVKSADHPIKVAWMRE